MNVCLLCFILSSAFVWKQGPFGLRQSSFILCVLCCSASWRHCWWTWCRSLWRADIPSWCCADQSLWWRSSSPTGCPCASTSTLRWVQFTSDGICRVWEWGWGSGVYAFYSISSLAIPAVWLVIAFVLSDWWWPIFGVGWSFFRSLCTCLMLLMLPL